MNEDNQYNMGAMSVSQFCKNYKISKSLFYKLKADGKMPPSFKLGTRTLMTLKSIEQWQNQINTTQNSTKTH